MATKIGDLFFDVYADVSRAIKDIDGVGSAAVKAGATAARAIGETVANAVGLAVGATALLVTTTLSAGAAYNTLGQSATAAFSSIYDDVSAAHSILEQISLLDLETPFQGRALTATARTLAGFGFQLGDVVDTTAALAQATAAMGLGSDALHRMAIAFGQIQSRGKLAGDEARQLANYGIDAYGLLADQLGITVAAVRELGQAGKLTSDFVIPALVNSIQTRFAGATEALFQTAAGQAEGLRSVMEGVGSALVEPFIGFSTGGALVDAMSALREELVQLVGVAEDGSFVLQGFLAPLTPLMESLAGSVVTLAEHFADFLGGLSDTALTDFAAHFEGLGPLIAAVGAGLLTVFAQAIPFVGRFVAGFNPIVVAVGALILTSAALRQEFGGALREIVDEVEPLIPKIQELLRNIVDLAEDAGPAVADILVGAFQVLTPILSETLDAANALIPVLGPILIELLEELSAVLSALAMLLDNDVVPKMVLLSGVVYGLTVAFPIVTAGIVANTAAVGLSGGAAAVAATSWGMLATAIAGAYAAYLAWSGAITGAASQEGAEQFLTRDASLLEKPFQDLARISFEAFSPGGRGSVETMKQWQEYDRLVAMNTETALTFARSQNAVGMSVGEFRERAEEAGLTYGTLATAVAEFGRLQDEQISKWREEAEAIGAVSAANLFEARVAQDLGGATEEMNDQLAETPDILQALKTAAAAAWAEVDRLLRPGADVTIDDFFRELPDLARDVTDALKAQGDKPGILSDLALGGAKEAVRQQARDVIETLAREYGIGLDEVKALLDERGLGAVIEALGTITEETEETVDPLIAKYASLGATADQVGDAIARLNDQRQTAIRAQIDQVEAALRDAKQAAQDARDAVAEFLSGGYLGSAQQQVDKLIGSIGNIGSQIEDGLRQGGVRGEAAVRSALGDLQGQLAAIVNAGMEQGLSGGQIVDLIGPVLDAINEEVGDASNRISSLDWSEGFTRAAGSDLVDALMRGMDPGAIQSLISSILGADASVAGLENRLEGLQAELRADVEFSPEQVQGALDAITAEHKIVTTTPVVTPEAAQVVLDVIQDVFDDPTNELDAAVDQAIITDQILEAAQAAEDQVSLVFRSALSFDSAELDAIARQVSDEFYAAFTDQMNQLRDQRAQEAGFDSYSSMVAALGPRVAAATVGGVSVSIDAPIEVTATGLPPDTEITATQRVAANSAAAGSGGSVNTLLQRYAENSTYRGIH
jgi:tape measure domain-containing protein